MVSASTSSGAGDPRKFTKKSSSSRAGRSLLGDLATIRGENDAGEPRTDVERDFRGGVNDEGVREGDATVVEVDDSRFVFVAELSASSSVE